MVVKPLKALFRADRIAVAVPPVVIVTGLGLARQFAAIIQRNVGIGNVGTHIAIVVCNVEVRSIAIQDGINRHLHVMERSGEAWAWV